MRTEAGGLGLQAPGININPQRINPINPDSDVRRGLRETDKRARQAASDLEKAIRSGVRNIENLGSEEAYFAFRDHVISRNPGRGIHLKPGSLHYKIIQPVLGRDIDITKIHLHFGAYVPGPNAAITFGNNIYVDAPYRPNDPHQAILLAHEITHSLQYERLGGERAFARRYFGQIWQAIRGGNSNPTCIHDALGLEKEANAMEDKAGKLVRGGVTIHNNTGLTVHYAMKRHDRGSWKQFTLESGKHSVHSTNFVDALDDFVIYSVHFDSEFRQGYQERAYHLDYDLVFDGKEFRHDDGRQYHFGKKSNGIDLFQGRGSSTNSDGSKTIVGGAGAGDTNQTKQGSPDPNLNPTFGSTTLKAGFTPDPYVKMLTAGGPLKTSLGGVNAQVAKAPDFRLNYFAGNYPLTIRVESSADTTLLINLPNGQWIANDDAGGNQNPLIRLARPQSGRYDIWVGTYNAGNARATLKITELK